MTRTLLKFILLFFIFFILFVLPNILIPSRVKIESHSDYNALMLFILLLTNTLILTYLIKRLELSGMKLFLAVVIIFWGLQTFMTQIETWYFREAMPEITDAELRNLFLRPLITSFTFTPLAILILGKWKHDSKGYISPAQANLTWKELTGLSVAYVVIYFVFGYFVAWQFEAVRIFYSGTAENVGFIEQMKRTIETKNSILLFQLLRGFLWVMIGFPLLHHLKGGKSEKIIACAIVYALPAIQLIVDNPFMPQEVRIAHLLEVASSNGFFGLLIGYVSTRKHA